MKQILQNYVKVTKKFSKLDIYKTNFAILSNNETNFCKICKNGAHLEKLLKTQKSDLFL